MSVSVLREDAAVPAGGVSVAALAWSFRGAVRVTAIAKATFAFAQDEPMTRVAPQPILRAALHHGNSPTRSVRLTTDLAPYLNRADVLLTGHAYAPNGVRVETLPARLSVFDGTQPLLDKTVLVRQRGGVNLVPLVYERAYGGVGWPDNPYGVGVPEGSGEPNLLDPFDERRVACFGPFGPGWQARLHAKLKRRGPEATGVLDLPDDLDWGQFQAAPVDQRVPFLRGDEWIVLDGMSRRHPRLRSRLPTARGLGLVYGLASWGVADGQPLALHADTLRIDADEEQCTLTFRATFPLADEAALPSVRVVLGVELPGQPVQWPEPASFLSLDESIVDELSSLDLEIELVEVLDGTMRLDSSSEADDFDAPLDETIPSRVPRSSALPFQAPVSSPSPLSRPSVAQRYADVPLSESGGTMMQSPEEEVAAAYRSALPFGGAAPPAPPPPAPPPPAPPAPEPPSSVPSWAQPDASTPQPAPAEPPSQRRSPPPRPPPPPVAPPPVQFVAPAAQPAGAMTFGACFLAAMAALEGQGERG